jgi:tyrosyl-DNA phosphodiesterase 2
MENFRGFKIDHTIYSIPLIRYCNILQTWDFVCTKNLNLKHEKSIQREELENNYFVNNGSETLTDTEESHESKENSQPVVKSNLQDSQSDIPCIMKETDTQVDNCEGKSIKGNVDSRTISSETNTTTGSFKSIALESEANELKKAKQEPKNISSKINRTDMKSTLEASSSNKNRMKWRFQAEDTISNDNSSLTNSKTLCSDQSPATSFNSKTKKEPLLVLRSSETKSLNENKPIVSTKPLKHEPILLKKKNIKFITYNIWFNEFNFKARTEEILKMCESKDPDFICLQEVTENFMSKLLGSRFIQSNFYIANVPFQLRNWYDVVILSKYCCNAYVIPFLSKMSRKLMYITLFNQENEMIKIGSAHLESFNNIYTRESQLSLSYKILDNFEKDFFRQAKYCFFLGDFNFTEKENDLISKHGYIDYGLEKIKKTDGKIEDWNTMKAMKGYPAWRPDRFTYKTKVPTFRVDKFEIIGKEPLVKETFFNPVGTPSDHYGIFAECTL